MDPPQKFFLLQAEPSGQEFERSRSNGQISLNLADQFLIICCELNWVHGSELWVHGIPDVYDL